MTDFTDKGSGPMDEQESAHDDTNNTPQTSFSVESFTRSWTRAAVFPVSPMVSSQHRGSITSTLRPRRLSEMSSFTILPGRTFSLPEPELRGQSTAARDHEKFESFQDILARRHGTTDLATTFRSYRTSIVPSLADFDASTPLLSNNLKAAVDPAFDRAHYSNVTQTVFNTVNLILGMGILGLPLAFKRAGLVIGLLCFIWSALTTLWTARLIARCLDREQHVRTFAELAYVAFGGKTKIFVMALVAIELTFASVGQIVLFSSGIGALLDGITINTWKVVCGIVFVPLTFVPLRFLGALSALSVLCFLAIAGILVAIGAANVRAPGSLRDPAGMSAFPMDWKSMPVAVGMILSTWGGHTVFPELYHDMRRPERFFTSIKYSYDITMPLYLLVGIVGYAMFGNRLQDAITSEIIALESTPTAVRILIVVLVTFFPVTKIPLNIFPLSTAIQLAMGLATWKTDQDEGDPVRRRLNPVLSTISSRTAIGVVFVFLAILFPELDQVMSFLGVVAGLTIAVILPILFYLSIFRDEIRTPERIFCWVTTVFAVILALGTTIWNVLL